MYMAVFEIETETEFASENVLNEQQARKQFDVMTKQMGARLDEWRQKNESAIVKKSPMNRRTWNIKIKLTATNQN